MYTAGITVIATVIFTARCYALERGYATELVCPSVRTYVRLAVCPSVTLRYVFLTGWNTWKIISRPNSKAYASDDHNMSDLEQRQHHQN